MMNCQDCREELAAALRIPEEQWPAEIKQHLSECAACRQEYLWLQKAQAAIRDDQPAELPENLHRSIMAAVAVGKLTLEENKPEIGNSVKIVSIKQRTGKNRWRLWTAAAVAAAAAVIMMIHGTGILNRPNQTIAEVGISDKEIESDSAATAGDTTQTEAEREAANRMMISPFVAEEAAGELSSDSEAIGSEGPAIAAKTLQDPTAAILPDPGVTAADGLQPEAGAGDPVSPDEPTPIQGIIAVPSAGVTDTAVRTLQIELDAELQDAILAAADSYPLSSVLFPATTEGSVTKLKIEGTGKQLVELLQGIKIPDDSAASLPAFSLLSTGDSEITAGQTAVSVYPIGSESVSLQAETIYQLVFQFQVK